ncbi:hemin uptake protein HemP [Rhodovulum steppense]|uniref:Hemin uptake protein HemP n=1 Tax=Rhodovulum steppense TaxID=540251 RepID=A0A4R1YT33_9RHOB|nr:hemin uptake protein HemP [Rhodovulum steppense]TCM82615.1 hemin uptake protein HemP [Rhodovulum steppense]
MERAMGQVECVLAGEVGGKDDAGAVVARAPEHDARRLTGGGSSAVIRLNGMDYQLRITRAGKLILTK